MTSFVPNYETDILVSYAPVDDQPFPGVKDGWVTTVVKTLKVFLAKRLGREDAYALTLDSQLAQHADLAAEISNALQRTATLIVIVSRGYLDTYLCQQEHPCFSAEEAVDAQARVFLIERDAFTREERCPILANLPGYRFWVAEQEGKPPHVLGEPMPHPDKPEDQPYYNFLNELSHALAARLRSLLKASAPAPTPTIAVMSEGGATVFLADVPEKRELQEKRDKIRSYLLQAQLRVLPERLYPPDPARFPEAAKKDVAQSQIFVQILTALAGASAADLSENAERGRAEYELALQTGLPILTWRPPEWKDVFLCHNSKDKERVKDIGKKLKGRGVLPWLDEWELRPGLPWQTELEKQIKHIGAAAVFIGTEGIGPWQDMELNAFLRKFVKQGCPVIPVLLPGCQEKPELPIFLEGMMWVDFRQPKPDPLTQLIWGITGEHGWLFDKPRSDLETIFAGGLVDFEAEIIRRVRPVQKTSYIKDIGSFVFVDADPNDAALAENICQVLRKFDIEPVSRLASVQPSKNSRSFEQFVYDCEALMIVYGNVTPKWVKDQCRAVQKIAGQRPRKLKNFVIYDGPPARKLPLSVPPLSVPEKYILSCRRHEVDEELLRHRFITPLQPLPSETGGES